MESIILLLLSGGVPYFALIERNKMFNAEKTLLLTAALLSLALVWAHLFSVKVSCYATTAALGSALWAVYRANKTTNFYRLGYYIVFVNAPLFVLFSEHALLYGVSLLLSLSGLYLVARFYDRKYGSANYLAIGGITLSTPYIGIFITIYLISIALYPPFPNAIAFLLNTLQGSLDQFEYFVAGTVFFANFYLAMKALQNALFGHSNPHIHYIDLSMKEKLIHLVLVMAMLSVSLFGLKEILA